MTIMLVDGNNLVRRIFEVHRRRTEKPFEPTREQLLATLRRIANRFHPSHAAIVYDNPQKTWRHFLTSTYKQNRPPTPDALLLMLPKLKQAVAEQMGIISLEMDGYEADDVIATLASGVRDKGLTVVIMSTDKGYQQLVDDHINVFDPFAQLLMTPASVQTKQSVLPEQLVDYWALTGDATNNIKGVAGIGPATARKLLERYTTLAEMLAADPDRKDAAMVQKQRQSAELSRQLVTLKTDVELGINLQMLRLDSVQPQ